MTNFMMKSYLAALFVAVNIVAQPAAIYSVTATQDVPLTTFTNTKRGYTFEYPENWTKKEGLAGVDIFLMAPKDSNGDSLANLSVISGELPKGTALKEYVQENIKNLFSSDPNTKVMDKGVTTVADVPAVWIRYEKGVEKNEITHYFFVSNGVGYLVTFGAANEVFEQNKPIFDKVIFSFKWK